MGVVTNDTQKINDAVIHKENYLWFTKKRELREAFIIYWDVDKQYRMFTGNEWTLYWLQ
jgi:hypothetical protein